MNKERRLQARLTEEDHSFLRSYADRNGLSMSQMVRDFIEWLRRRDSGTQVPS